ncbi:hypothetical protein [Bacillus sp. CGMCC 1.16541]|uniref:hypothetical protein n=1 Tax=Bacillus sp. CGMCC 1.16541 TaxID=2185143 RepID=UPI000D72F545|nr:hypothetical protein [Bacillus sp. CGMCC 1.16541]
MNNVKKALVGTALAGTLVVGAGFGTYSWFTSNATVSGEVENTNIKLKGGGTFNFAAEKLAPSRTKVAENWVTVENESDDKEVRLKVDVESVLSGGKEGINFSQYRSGGVVVFNTSPAPFFDKAYEEALKTYLAHSNPGPAALTNFISDLQHRFTGLDVNIVEINRGNIGNINAFTRDISSDKMVVGVISEETMADLVREKISKEELFDGIITNAHNVHFLFGTHLKKTAGNDYQGAKVNMKFDVTARQIEAPKNANGNSN